MSSASTPPPRPTTRPQHRLSTGNVNLQHRQQRVQRRSTSSSPHGSSGKPVNATRRRRPEITIVSAQPMSTHPAFADGAKGGYIPPEAPPSYDDALKSAVPLDPMFTDPAIPDHISANLRVYPSHEFQSGSPSSSLPIIHTVSLPPPRSANNLSNLTVISPTPHTRRNIGNSNHNNNTTNESTSLHTAETTNSASENSSNKENTSSRKPEIPTKPKNLRKGVDNSTLDNPQATSSITDIQNTAPHLSSSHNKIQKRVAVNPELTEAEIQSQEEYHKKKQKIIERLKRLKEEQKLSESGNIVASETTNMTDNNDTILNGGSEIKKPLNRRLPPPPRPPSLPSVKPRSVHPAVSVDPSTQLTSTVPSHSDVSQDNVSHSQVGVLLNFDDDDPYATIDQTKGNNSLGEKTQNNNAQLLSNVDLLCFELGAKSEAPINEETIVFNTDVEINGNENKNVEPVPNSFPMPAPRRTKHEYEAESDDKPEDVYSVLRKPRKNKIEKTLVVAEQNSVADDVDTSISIALLPPSVPSSRPPLSDYDGVFESKDSTNKAINMDNGDGSKPPLPVAAPPRTKRVHRTSSTKSPDPARRNQTNDTVRRNSLQKTPEISRKIPSRPVPPPIPGNKPKATVDDAVVYSKNKHHPPEQATLVLRKKKNGEPKKKRNSFKINRKSLGFFSTTKKENDGNSSSTSSSSEKTKPSPKLRPKSVLFPSRPNNMKPAKSPVHNPTNLDAPGRKPVRSAPPRPVRPAPANPRKFQSNNNNSSENLNQIEKPVPTARPRSKSMAAKCVSMQSESVQTERPPPPNRPAPTRTESIKPLRPPPAKVTKETQTQTVTFNLGGETLKNLQQNESNGEIKDDIIKSNPQPVVANKKPLGKVCAKFVYDSNEPEDLQFNSGDIIVVLNEINHDWYKGKLKDAVGIFPKAYVGELKSVPPARPQLLQRSKQNEGKRNQEPPMEKVSIDHRTEQQHTKSNYDPTTPNWEDDHADAEEDEQRNWDVTDLDKSPVPAKQEDLVKQIDEFFDAVQDLSHSSSNDSVDGFVQKDDLEGNVDGVVKNTHALNFSEETPIQVVLNDARNECELENDVISNDFIEYIKPKCAVAIYNFEGASEEELSFDAGNMINVTGEINEEWLKGEFRGKCGIFPSSFIQEIKES